MESSVDEEREKANKIKLNLMEISNKIENNSVSVLFYCLHFFFVLEQVSRRGGFSDASPKHGDDDNEQEIAALAAITGAIMEDFKKKAQMNNKQNIIQIIIYESSV